MNNVILKNKCKIKPGEYVEKESKKDLEKLFLYLSSRSFDNYPEVLNKKENKYRYQYIKSTDIESKEYYEELVRLMANLHYKTSYFKEISKDRYRTIYEKLENNINYIEKYYEDLLNKLETSIFSSPSSYLLLRNYSVINGSINYAKSTLKSWFNLVKDKTKERVCAIHNNLSKDKFIKGDKHYFVSWENSIEDSPVLDIYKFFINEKQLDYSTLYNEYNNIFKLSKEEQKLLFILLSIPIKIEFCNSELESTYCIKQSLKFMYKVESLINENK